MRRAPLPPEVRGVAQRSGDLSDLGVTRSRRRASDAQHPFRGVTVFDAPPAPSLVERCRTLLPVLGPGCAFSHATAAALWGGTLPSERQWPSTPLEVAVLDDRTPPRRRGVRGRRVAAMDLTMLRGLPVVVAEDAWLQLASGLGRADLVALGDSLLTANHRAGVTTIPRLRAHLDRRAHAYGIRAARAAVEDLRVGAESRPESLLRLRIRAAGFPEPTVAPPVRVGGGLLLHPDLGYPEQRIAIEYEGDHHRTDRAQWEHDIERRRLLADAGWRCVQVTAVDLFRDPAGVFATLRRLLT